jgi:hypothetical protein
MLNSRPTFQTIALAFNFTGISPGIGRIKIKDGFGGNVRVIVYYANFYPIAGGEEHSLIQPVLTQPAEKNRHLIFFHHQAIT